MLCLCVQTQHRARPRALACLPPEDHQHAGGHQEDVLPRMLPCQLRPVRRRRRARLGVLQGLALGAQDVNAPRQGAACTSKPRAGQQGGCLGGPGLLQRGPRTSKAPLRPPTHSCARATLTRRGPARPACWRTGEEHAVESRSAARRGGLQGGRCSAMGHEHLLI